MLYTLAGGGTLCGVAALVLLIVSTATDFWMQYRYSGSYANQGLWRFCINHKCHAHTMTVGEYFEGDILDQGWKVLLHNKYDNTIRINMLKSNVRKAQNKCQYLFLQSKKTLYLFKSILRELLVTLTGSSEWQPAYFGPKKIKSRKKKRGADWRQEFTINLKKTNKIKEKTLIRSNCTVASVPLKRSSAL